ncbi:hypothetical protein KBD08_02010 [Candidatus Babeliales bacterium]|nr:hypothetical protein [Candidatus Babeliales bacterium]
MVQSDKICCLIDPASSSNSYFFKVSVPAQITKPFLSLATEKHQDFMHPAGFKKGLAPLTYIQEHFKAPIVSHLKDMGLKFFGINALLQHMRNNKIVLVGIPELRDVQIDAQGNLTYLFEGYAPKELYMQSWKFLPFKPTPRKKYRDIDKQVMSFLQDEELAGKQHDPNKGIQVGDWIYVQIALINHKKNPVFDYKAHLWIKVGDEEPDLEFQRLFFGKNIQDTIITDNPSLQSYFCENSHAQYLYHITIIDIVPDQAFSFDLFKQYFKIKTHKDLLNKITEVFSFNNDISQRRMIAHDALGLIIRKNHIVLPDGAINAQRKQILQDLQFKPDFIVYKMDPDFDIHITNMAKRQLLDSVVAESISYQDNITTTHMDIKSILHLTQRPRLKDFLYFPFLKTQVQGQEFPVEYDSLYHYTLKEKSINHIIYHLTKK